MNESTKQPNRAGLKPSQNGRRRTGLKRLTPSNGHTVWSDWCFLRDSGFNSRTDPHPVTIPGTQTMMQNNYVIVAKRLAVLKELEQLLQDIEQDMNNRIPRVRQNIGIAEDNLLDDGEYNYCVRLALHQLSSTAASHEVISAERTNRIDSLRAALEQKAALPPQEQLTR